MAWSWRYETAAGEPLDDANIPAGEAFPSQADAETWLGENWRELLTAGVAQVSLLDEDRLVYGGMGLQSPE
jgi:hypothetical protein